MAIAHVATDSDTGGGDTTVDVPIPAGGSSGDIMVAYITVRGDEQEVPSAPSGWTEIRSEDPGTGSGNDVVLRAYWKEHSGNESTPQQWTYTGTPPWVAACSIYSDVDTTSPVNNDSGGTDVTNDDDIDAPGHTNTSDGCMVVWIGAQNTSSSATVSPPSGFTERMDAQRLTAFLMASADKIQASAGATGDPIRGFSSVTGNSDAAILISLEPASTGSVFTETVTDDLGLTDDTTAVSTGRIITDSLGLTDTDVEQVTDVTLTVTENEGLTDEVASAPLDGGDSVGVVGGDATSTTTTVPLESAEFGFGSDLLFNRVAFTREGGTVQVVEDATSQARYGIRNLTKSGLLNNDDADVATLAGLRLARVGEPARNVESLTVLLDIMSDAQAAVVASVSVGDLVRVVVSPPGYEGRGPVVSSSRVEQVEHRVSTSSHSIRYRLTSLADEFGAAVDGGTAATVSFDDTWDGGTAATVSFADALDGGDANYK